MSQSRRFFRPFPGFFTRPARREARRPVLRVLTGTLAVALAAALAPPAAAEGFPQSRVVSDNPVDWTPSLVQVGNAKPIVDAIAQTGSTVVAGGSFTRLARSGTTYNRSNLVMFTTTGAILPAAPNPNGRVWALLAVGNYVYIGGEFNLIGGAARPGLARIDVRTGRVDPTFRPAINGRVNVLKLARGRLYVAGSFPSKLVALNPTTGANTNSFTLPIADPVPGAWGASSVYGMAINPAGTRLIATGNFRRAGGQSRTKFFMANISGTRATLDPWYYQPFARGCATDAPRRVANLQGVDFAPDGSYFVIAATGQIPLRGDIDVTVCDGVGKFFMSNDNSPAWINYTGGDSVWSVSATGSAVYAQGHFQWLDNPRGFASQPGPGAVRRRGIGAINPGTGKALAWNPDKPAAIGGKVLLATSTGLWVGSDSVSFNGEPRRGIAFCPLP